MKKWYMLIGIIFILAGVGFGIYWFNSNNQNLSNNNYNASRIASDTDNTSILENNNINNFSTSNDINNTAPEKTYSEKEISSFSTKIYTKESDRQNNISVACSELNGTTVKDGDTFSFTKTVGKTSTSKGYEKADVFVDGEVEHALGGGICQVSTTLYNAVRSVSKLKVTERHSHSNDVPYIPKGKDAAVAYGSYDFKFVNNTGNTIKIEAKNTKNKVTIKLYELK